MAPQTCSLLLCLAALAYGYTVRPLPQLAGTPVTHRAPATATSLSRIYACAAETSSEITIAKTADEADPSDAEFVKRLAYADALKAAILEQQKPKPTNRVAVVAGFLAVLVASGAAISFAFSPAADQFTGRLG